MSHINMDLRNQETQMTEKITKIIKNNNCSKTERKMSKFQPTGSKNCGVSLPPYVVKHLDSIRGGYPRSKIVLALIKKSLELKEPTKAEIRKEKTLHSHKYKGGKVDTVITRKGEVKLDNGNLTIPCGGYPALENTNYARVQQNRDRHLESETKKLVRRITSLNSMGIAATYNRLFAPLREPSSKE